MSARVATELSESFLIFVLSFMAAVLSPLVCLTVMLEALTADTAPTKLVLLPVAFFVVFSAAGFAAADLSPCAKAAADRVNIRKAPNKPISNFLIAILLMFILKE